MFGRALLVAGLLPLALTSAACSRAVDIKQTFRIVDVHGGYFDAGVVNGKNKLIPTVVFRIEKTINEAVRPVSVNVLFKKIVPDGEEEWDDVFLQRVEFTDGNRTQVLTVRPEAGVTGEDPRSEMLKNSQFVDIRAVIFVKQSSANWVELARYDIPRQLLTN
jgi:hypothetical protein